MVCPGIANYKDNANLRFRFNRHNLLPLAIMGVLIPGAIYTLVNYGDAKARADRDRKEALGKMQREQQQEE